MSVKVILKGVVAFTALKSFGIIAGLFSVGISWFKQLLGENN